MLADTLLQLSWVYRSRGDGDRAHRIVQEVLDIRRSVFPPDAPEIAEAVYELGFVAANNEELEVRYREALAILERTGARPEQQLRLRHGLTTSLRRQGRFAEALEQDRRALDFATRRVRTRGRPRRPRAGPPRRSGPRSGERPSRRRAAVPPRSRSHSARPRAAPPRARPSARRAGDAGRPARPPRRGRTAASRDPADSPGRPGRAAPRRRADARRQRRDRSRAAGTTGGSRGDRARVAREGVGDPAARGIPTSGASWRCSRGSGRARGTTTRPTGSSGSRWR